MTKFIVLFKNQGVKNARIRMTMRSFCYITALFFYLFLAGCSNLISNPAQKNWENGLNLFNQSDYQNAIEEFRQSVKMDPDFWQSHLYLARCFNKRGQYDDAIYSSSKALSLNPSTREAKDIMLDSLDKAGNKALQRENYEEAIAYFTEYIEYAAKESDVYLKLGVALLQKERLREAINTFKEALNLDPGNEEAKSLIKKSIFDEARKFSREGKDDISMRYLTGYLTINADDVDTHLALAKAFIKRGDSKNAIWSLNKAVSLDPKNPEVIELLDYFSGGFH